MDTELGEGVTLGDVSDGAKAASSLVKSLPGMAKPTDDENDITNLSASKVITKQPGGVDLDNAMDKADKASNCCGKLFDCFDKGLDAADKVQGLTEG